MIKAMYAKREFGIITNTLHNMDDFLETTEELCVEPIWG